MSGPRRWSVGLVLVATFLATIPAAGATRATATTETLRIAAEQEPSCADWLHSCSGSIWGNWVLGNLTLPQAYVVTPAGDYTPGALLTGEPTVTTGPPLTVTYRIRSDAVWSDGQPITSKDFEYTWHQITTDDNVLDRSGYVDISSIDTKDPKVAVVTFSKPYAAWRDLFGGFYYVLPSHLLEGRDRHRVMKDGYSFSGGPWKLEHGKDGWDKGRSLTFVPNHKFWGAQPTIPKVVFQVIGDSSAELQAVETGQVAAAYPRLQPAELDRLDKNADLTYTVSTGTGFEALWFNVSVFPLDSQAVRRAVAFATDRQAIVDQVLKPTARTGRVLQSFLVPTFRQYYVPSFDQYHPDAAAVARLMTSDGWQKGGDGVWAKGGRQASIVVNAPAGDKNRQLVLQIWQSQLEAAGFSVSVKLLNPAVLFGQRVPKGAFQVGLFGSTGTPDPGLCVVFCSENIPTKENDFAGSNYWRVQNAAIDTAWRTVDSTLDTNARVQAAKDGQALLADQAVSLPLYQNPSLFVYDHTRLGGMLVDNPVMGPFFTLNEWTAK